MLLVAAGEKHVYICLPLGIARVIGNFQETIGINKTAKNIKIRFTYLTILAWI
jgi:hypothetical protein